MSHCPPSFACLRFSRRDGPGPALWLPIFLLWPLWFAVLGVFCLLLLVVTAATGSNAYRASLAATRALHEVACGLRGTRCEVSGDGKHFRLSLV
jgi:hypothetical protein